MFELIEICGYMVYLCRSEHGTVLNASCVINPLTKTIVGAVITQQLSAKKTFITLGGQYAFNPLTTVKARLQNSGKVSSLIQHEWYPKSLFTISAEVDTKALTKSPKIGIAVVLKP